MLTTLEIDQTIVLSKPIETPSPKAHLGPLDGALSFGPKCGHAFGVLTSVRILLSVSRLLHC